MYREDKHHHNAIAVRQGNGHIHSTPCRCIGCRESKKKNAHKKMFLQSIKITEKNRRRTGEMKTEKRKKTMLLNTCVSIYFNHTNTCLKPFPTTSLISMRYKNRRCFWITCCIFFRSILNSVHFILVFFFESSKQLLGWNRRESSVFGALTNESNVYHGDRQSILFHFMSKIDQAAISSVFDQQISECYLLGRKRSNKIIDKPSKNEYFIFTSIESAYTIWCAAWSSEKQRQTCVSLKGLSVFFLFLSKFK